MLALRAGMRWAFGGVGLRTLCTPSARESMEFDVLIVGAGPAGLAAAIRLKQLREDTNVCVIDKGSEVGAHILSGNVFEPRALDELLPEWRTEAGGDDFPFRVPVKRDLFRFLTPSLCLPLPTPPQMHNQGNYICSLSEVTRWLASHAEEAGVEIYPGFAAAEPLIEDGRVVGVATGDMGIAKDGSHKDTYERGMELRARYTLMAEGCRGSLSQQLMQVYNLREGVCPQTYALGIKEVWEIKPENHREGEVWHSVGWPLEDNAYGGSFLYHMDENRVSIGYVVGLDYRNPHLSPFGEFQRFKQHPTVRAVLEGGTVLQYGARTLNEGGLQSIPKLVFPGGALIGCSAGFLNVPKIKGTHTAMKSGMLAAESVAHALDSEGEDEGLLNTYPEMLRSSWVWEELNLARNIRPGFQWGFWAGMVYAGIDTYLFGGRAPWTLKHKHTDHDALEPAAEHTPIEYPKPDNNNNNVVSDIPTSLFRSGTDHDHNQPAHLRLRDADVPGILNRPVYACPEEKFCPAKVYEYVQEEHSNEPVLKINAQNCLHCKACDIKDPSQNIQWTVPEGGGGPKYTMM